ncbi:MAG: tRNA uridine-5-carboxymethylaminomethyl(34) synthesis GTPase MnmE [Novosphingobium sp. 28-62-57]|uniref:tRNA uridine-5-carboxymethylaminomethyl(34) synthesis GTPase MnmE n=1 Tax=unclassified Novosphingobium TaxID=2644732 RepID=UPI000BD5744C|nr:MULTISPECIES: tRNA uridine-5-carboxymethylaminomethyl(34) synthesis GTPase MnmE [unclassified Novosphingobium]OYW50258.1 MAG: tRNA uridine-5-carboxymethylaminomethyl(34) synthesis GTPase MnmE [Novosphingobium sp. 12-62-10]OYZ11637.1 MAG: tRNA uridine-5-carboxymethylaminomethyl(34) synthesis GTPase MnmE [Novosphingobium sp. 28-62-57]OZA36978.1 MAG: tRNA uridine-5-carboxymethylaminomethyl(34) synthesis GTPase MnmE [Novosphingobium sp. 17-62-9]HQS68810.1 tRNA uridine-5-carboxymethylaminomethyl(
MSQDTIFALSSGPPPAGIAVIRISGPQAGPALTALVGKLPTPRRATLATLAHPQDGAHLDRTMILWLPGPGTATGEDSAELHLHGGRAVVAAVEAALATLPDLRRAQAGEFTRRAFAHGRIDLAEAEGLADLLSAETELQRRAALAMAEGTFSREVENWRATLLQLSARLEAALDFSDEDDVGAGEDALPSGFIADCTKLAQNLEAWLTRPRAEPLKEGFRVVLAGPPNAGKSTLFNALVEQEAAITAAEPGTTRDVLTHACALDGIPFVFVDTAGLRDEGAGEIERIGIARAKVAAQKADLILWLGPEGEGPEGEGPDLSSSFPRRRESSLWEVSARADDPTAPRKSPTAIHLSARTGEGMNDLRQALITHARQSLPAPGEAALNQRQHTLLSDVAQSLHHATTEPDPLLAAENLRLARRSLDSLIGRTSTEDMLDTLFGKFCIGK